MLTLQEPWHRPVASLESLQCGMDLQALGGAGFFQLAVADRSLEEVDHIGEHYMKNNIDINNRFLLN